MSHRRRGWLAVIYVAGTLVSLIGWLLWQEVHQEQLDHALIAAIKQNDTTAALAALQAHANPNGRDTGGAPPSFWHYLQIRWQQIRSKKSAPTRNGPTALTLAVRNNNAAIVQALLSKGAKDVGEKLQGNPGIEVDEKSCTLLMFAASNNSPAIVHALARSGSDVNAVDADKDTALFYCGDRPTVQALADCGTIVNAKDKFGWTALDYSIRKGSPSACQALINRGAKDAKAMSVAAEFGDTTTLKQMLDAGWNMDRAELTMIASSCSREGAKTSMSARMRARASAWKPVCRCSAPQQPAACGALRSPHRLARERGRTESSEDVPSAAGADSSAVAERSRVL